MKIQTTKSFDDLMKSYYGVASTPELSNNARVEALLTQYYGRPYKRKKKCPPPVSVSLSHDDGETIAQPVQETHFEEYVVQKSVTEEPFEEYVVAQCSHFDERPVAVAASLNIQSSDPVNVAQEYEVDVLEPLRPEPFTSAAQSLPPAPVDEFYPAAEPVRAYEQSTRPYTPTAAETEEAKPSEDDFISDMKSILMGKSVFDPATGKTVEKDSYSRGPSNDTNRSNDRNFPEADRSQAIFDRIAQSMQYANAYDLGTVELENRFADFDRVSDLQQRAKDTQQAARQEPRVYSPAPESTTNASDGTAKVDSGDFIRDMDEIQNIRAEAANQVSALSQDDEAEPDPAPFALSLSDTDDPNDFSRPLYDTGEHVLSGWDLYTDQLRVGKSPGLMFSYGQIIAMADLYDSVETMMKADVNELKTLKALIELSATYYRGKLKGRPDPDMDVSNERWQEATNKRYLALAEKNYKHFSPPPVFKKLPRIATTEGNNKSEWEAYHRKAINAARGILLKPENKSKSVFLEYPLIINAFGDHFLTDAFASGHLVNKEVTMAYFKANFLTGKSLKPEANTFFQKVAAKAFTGKVKEKFSKLEVANFVWKGPIPVGYPDISDASRFATLLIEIAKQETDQIGNLAVKALHDSLNRTGIEVTNNAGDGTWKVFGDGNMDQKSLDILRKAVSQSVNNINDPSIASVTINFDTYFAKVWQYIPQLTPSSLQYVENLTAEFTNPTSTKLIDAAAQIITEQVDILISKLIDRKALRSNTQGWFPNVH